MLEANNLTLRLQSGAFRPWSLRELFVRFWTFSKSNDNTVKSFQLGPLSFYLKPGDSLGVLGLNGAGKTSLCRVVSGLYEPSDGVLRVSGSVLPILDVDIGHFPDLSALENLQVAFKILWPDRVDVLDEACRSIIDFAELSLHMDKPFRVFSTGMKTRLALSLFTFATRDILVIDEALDGVDASFKQKWDVRFKHILRQTPIAVIVSHDLEKLREFCNRGLLLESGRCLAQGSIHDVIKEYKTLYRIQDKN